MRLSIATHNPGKRTELTALLAAHGVAIDDTPVDDTPAETGRSYRDNAAIKACAMARRHATLALGDDTGLAVAMLGGAPGIDTAGYAAAHGGWASACRELVRRTGASAGARDVRATLHCALVLASPERVVAEGSAAIPGVLRWPPVAAPGLAAIFEPDGSLPLLTDGVLVHRRVAFEQLWPALARAITSSDR
ncbi:MAG: non-canonical purine NTP pyrophosphatase [Deltaproteobacteria bacterium]|nr:non-canonical purine NTP pyrophosphatase [Deltaproteobacteria bacterium]MBK8718800.1 non-canonical purine NTP pyrophosphatase [Deltaproteobacteria bacterium]MBP7286517.1 hypothetical protein [Nannocystaceae bacterium]